MTALQKIQKEAKRLRKIKPSMPYQTAIKEASKAYNNGKLGATKTAAKKAPTKKAGAAKLPVKKVVTTVTKEKLSGTGTSTMHAKTFISLTDIGNELLILEHRTRNKEIGVAQRNLYKRQFKALKAYLNTRAKFV